MGIFTKSPIGDIVKEVGGLVDDMHFSGEEKAKFQLRLRELEAEANVKQLEVNTEEAKNSRLFVSGWRPAVGWTCAFALFWVYVASPLIQSLVFYIASFSGVDIDLSGLPVIELAGLMPVLLGMLGLGGLRTYEKVKGVASTRMGVDPRYTDTAAIAKAALLGDTALQKGPKRGS